MAYEQKEKKKDNSTFLPFIQEYRKKIEDELTKMCNNVISIIETVLLKRTHQWADAPAILSFVRHKDVSHVRSLTTIGHWS